MNTVIKCYYQNMGDISTVTYCSFPYPLPFRYIYIDFHHPDLSKPPAAGRLRVVPGHRRRLPGGAAECRATTAAWGAAGVPGESMLNGFQYFNSPSDMAII